MHKYLRISAIRGMAVVLLASVFLPLGLFADEPDRKLVPVDQDFVLLSLKQDKTAQTESLFAESKDGGAVDWVTYVIQLDPGEVGTTGDILVKTNSNRTTFSSEKNVMGMIYVPAKSKWRYLDVTSLISDAIMDGVFGNALKDRVTIPSADGRAYIVRSYSGAFGTNVAIGAFGLKVSFGTKNDPEERAFVTQHVDEGDMRTTEALIANVIAGGFDTLAIVAPTDFIAGNGKVWVNAMTKVITAEVGELGLKSGTQQHAALDYNTLRRMTNSVFNALLTASNDLIAQNMDTVQRTALERSASFFGNIADMAFSVVAPVKTLSKGGQVAMRVVDMIYATPLETAYIVNTPLAIGAPKEEQNVASVPDKEEQNVASVSDDDGLFAAVGLSPLKTESETNVAEGISHIARDGEVTFSVVTGYPSNASSTSCASMNGTVVVPEDGTSNFISAWTEYGKNGTFERSTEKRNTSNDSRNFQSNLICEFENNTTYSFRAVAQKGNAIAYGEVHTFTVGSPSGPVGTIKHPSPYTIVFDKFNVVTGYPSNASSTSCASMNGTVVVPEDGTSNFISAWTEYGKNGTFERSTEKRNTSNDSRNFQSNLICEFEKGVTYSFRAVGQKGGGNVIYGEAHTFTMWGK